MNGYEEIRGPSTMDGGEGLLAIIIRSSYQGTSGVKRKITDTQEVLIVRRGIVSVDIYVSTGEHVATRILYAGDVIALVAGGHGLTINSDADILEIKQGRYMGADDKQPLSSRG